MKIFSFIKNEKENIEDWLRYHSNLVGIKNLYIIDHSSNDGTEKILQLWKEKGLNLFSNSGPFKNKHRELTKLMNQYKDDFLIPLDADEFIVLKKDNEVITDESLIKKTISDLPIGPFRYKFHQLDIIPTINEVNDPLINMHSFKTKWYKDWSHYAKTFYHSKFFISTDQGNHKGSVNGHGNDLETNLTLIHFDIKNYKHFVEKVTRGATAYDHHLNRVPITKAGRHYHRRFWAIKSGKGKAIMQKEFGVNGNFTTTSLSEKLKSLR